MKKMFFVLIIVTLVCGSISFADPLKFYLAVEGLDVYDINNQKRAIDAMGVQAAVNQQNSLKDNKSLIKKFKINQQSKDELNMEIAINTSAKKTRMGNQIKDMGYRVEENATFLGARKLYLGALSAKLNLELAQLKVENKQSVLAGDKVKLDKGVISEIAYQQSQKQLEELLNAHEAATIAYNRTYAKLANMLNGDVVVTAEDPRTTPLAPLEYYYNQIDNRLEIMRPSIQIDIIKLDLPFYDNEIYQRRDDIDKQINDLLRDQKQYQLDIDQQRFKLKKEIQSAYIDIQRSIDSLDSFKAKLENLSGRLAQMQALYDKGLITQAKIDDLRVSLKQVENGYILKSVELNNKRIALGMAVSVGPAY